MNIIRVMSLPNYLQRGNNNSLMEDNYISKTVGYNTNNGINLNDPSFLTTYPVQGRVRPVSSAPSPAPSPALATTRFYVTDIIVISPNNIRTNSDFARFSNNEEYIVYLDNYFMYPPSHYINKPLLTYFKTGSLPQQLDSDGIDKGYLFILSDDKVPYYITNDFNSIDFENQQNTFIITKRKNLTSYYAADTANPAITVDFNLKNPKFNPGNIIEKNVISNLKLLNNYRYNTDFTLHYNFRLYATNLTVVKESSLMQITTSQPLPPNTEDGYFTGNIFRNSQVVFFDNFNKINKANPDESFDTNPTDITSFNSSNLYIYDESYLPFYLRFDNIANGEVYVSKKINPSLPPEVNEDLRFKVHYKILKTSEISKQTPNFLTTLANEPNIIFSKVVTYFSANSIGSFRNPRNTPPAAVGGPPPAAVGSIVARLYATTLTFETIPSIANFAGEFSNIVPNDAANVYYVDHTKARDSCTGLSPNKCYTMIPVGCNQNKIKVPYTVNEASNNPGGKSKLRPNTSVGDLQSSWANVLNNGPNFGDKIAQPVKDQRAVLSNTFNSNIITMEAGSNGIDITNFTDKTVYYSNANSLASGTDIPLSNLYVKHNNSDWYFKIQPFITGTAGTDYIFKWFWKISNNKTTPRQMFVTLSNSSDSKRFTKSDASNVKTVGSQLQLTSFTITTT